MEIDKGKKGRRSDGYKRNNLLSAMNEPGENLTALSKELKKLAAFMHNSNTDKNKENLSSVSEEIREKRSDNFTAIDNFLEDKEFEESSIDDILKSEGISSDYFSFSESENNEICCDEQIKSIDSFLDAIENGKIGNNSNTNDTEGNEDLDYPIEETDDFQAIDESFYTESLAYIYIKQRKYAKALEIIKCISLKNPEKNIYFADQIRFLEKLIINVKSE